VLVVIAREPGVILHPQFYAEDGQLWFADAYNRGWLASLFRTQQAGYIEILPRIAAGFALLVPLVWAPLVMNLVGILVEAAPVPLLLSRRLADWGSLRLRASFAALYLVLPCSHEIHVTVTNAQWYLAIFAALLLLARVPRRSSRWWDAALFLLIGLDGPFPLLLLPVAALYAIRRRESWRWAPVAILCATSLIQAGIIVHFAGQRQSVPLGASIHGFVNIIGSHIFLATLVGHNTLAPVVPFAWMISIAVLGSIVAVWLLWRATFELRLFSLFAAIVAAAGLGSPAVGVLRPGGSSWETLSLVSDQRYWTFAVLSLAWLFASAVFSARATQGTKALGAVFLTLMLYGICRDFRFAPLPDLHFDRYAAEFARLPRGQKIVIPENPVTITKSERQWSICLVK
jgi:hypothetical protein